jgi:hypothetical protein
VKAIRYRITPYRLLVLWSLPIFFLTFILLVFFSKFDTIYEARRIDIIAFTLLILFSVGTFVFLFFNHLPLARQTELVIQGKLLTIIRGGKVERINYSEITSIKEYSAKRLPWGFIMKWSLKTNEKEYIISSLTISQLNFERHVNDKTETKVLLFPKVEYCRQRSGHG